jgi:S1-C subfamily serine protease
MRRLALFAALVWGLLAGCSAGGPGDRNAHPRSGLIPPASMQSPPTSSGSFNAVRAAAQLQPAVGMVIVNTRSGTTSGSGFVVGVQGGTSYMVTNSHVVADGRRTQVLMPDGRHFLAQVQGSDSLEDVAVLRIDASLPLAQFADSSRAQVGEPVLAIGSPLGNEGTVTVGVVSALHRALTDVGGGTGTPAESLPDVLQTDAPINPGNSGGPLADGNGNVVGMNTAGSESANGIGFAIPSLIVKRIAENLIAGRRPGHPYVGVCYQPLAQALAQGQDVQGYGVVVRGTVAGSPAAHVGIRSGDVIEKVDGIDLTHGRTLGGALQLHNPGDSVPITFARDGSAQDVRVTLAEQPPSPAGC